MTIIDENCRPDRRARLGDFNLGELDLIPAGDMAARLRDDPRLEGDLDDWIAGDCRCLGCLAPFDRLPPLWIAGCAGGMRLPLAGMCARCCCAPTAEAVMARIAAGFRRAGLPLGSMRPACSCLVDGGRA